MTTIATRVRSHWGRCLCLGSSTCTFAYVVCADGDGESDGDGDGQLQQQHDEEGEMGAGDEPGQRDTHALHSLCGSWL